MREETLISDKLAALKIASPAGYALGLHVVYTTPTYMFQSYPRAWLDLYAQKGFLMTDPIVHWGFENTGSVRWSSLTAQDTQGVLVAAAEHGLNFGVTVALETDAGRSFGGFSRGDREFTEDEMQALYDHVSELHTLTASGEALPESMKEKLKTMSVNYTHPGA
ncbi:autoinducer binding domain-containing protein [Yoonia sp. 208BN28-4]|uniref:autoinducer binding domain-containing protein n=1 Tax=Yoonia sp. 208BN28-4 TaxID=3126505 RepID=UPI0030997896